ncbi:hypothetical protein DFH27DRAFT_604589 [Peziza echinospora]|nr:hypothetical protein DFH27DRAFT_604589 [Peziza echinospora]
MFGCPPTPRNSSPPCAPHDSQSSAADSASEATPAGPPTPAPSVLAPSSPPTAAPDETTPESADTLQLTQIARFIRLRAGGLNPARSLRLVGPSDAVLREFAAAKRSADEPPPAQPRQYPAGHPFAAVDLGVLARIRYRLVHHPPLLVLRPMPTALHNCIQVFVAKHLLSADPVRGLALAAGLLTGAETACVDATYGTSIALPGGPADAGFRDPCVWAGTVRRRKPRALQKEPDVALRYVPPSPPPSPSSSPAPEAWLFDDTDGSSGDEGAASAFPAMVMEIGYCESYDDLLADCADYLVSSEGRIRAAVLVHIVRPPPAKATPTADAQHQQPDDADAAADSAADSGAEDYDAEYRRIVGKRRSRADADADRTRPAPPAFDAYLEVWEYTATAATRTATSPAVHPHIRLRSPGRITLLHRGGRKPTIPVPLRRTDFGLPATAPIDGNNNNNSSQHSRPIDFSAYAKLLQRSAREQVYTEHVNSGKLQRSQKRVREGDVGGEYMEWEGAAGDQSTDGNGNTDGAGDTQRETRSKKKLKGAAGPATEN